MYASTKAPAFRTLDTARPRCGGDGLQLCRHSWGRDQREGLTATHPNLRIVMPLRERGIDKRGVIELLDGAGLGLPDYYRWRSRSGCTFCFFQQKIEWVNLMREHPQAFEEAKRYEKTALDHGSPFTWSDRESLTNSLNPSVLHRSSGNTNCAWSGLEPAAAPTPCGPKGPKRNWRLKITAGGV